MVSFILPGNSASTGYEVANSLRFDGGSTDYLSQTISSSTGKIFTYSVWFKKSANDSINQLFHLSSDSNTNNYIDIATKSGYGLDIQFKNGSGGTFLRRRTNRLLRDFSAWMHVVVRFDSTQASASDRFRLYINGVQETSLDVDSTPDIPQDYVTDFNTNGSTLYLGRNFSGSVYGFDGYMAEVVLVDGSSLAPTSFGEFDEDSGIWKPIDVSGLTFGTNGFHLDFENSSSLGADVSGQGNNFTVNNLTSIDQSTDTCTNNGCTIINASTASKTYTLSEGNLKVTASASNWYGVPRGSIGVSSGKWYYEVKVTDENDNFMAGFMSATNLADVGDRATNGFPKLNGFQSSGYIKRQDNTEVNISSSFQWDDGDIGQIALDMDNKKLWIGKNGTYYNSGNPATGSNETIGSSYFTSGEAYLPALIFYGTNDASFNFGSPPYSISSGNSDGNSYGNFEYSVPSGYYALNTKNLADYG